MTHYDIIGDIHGCADKLEALLHKLDYKIGHGYYQHPERRVIFLGDFIDRGPQQEKTLSIVRPMIDSGKAMSVMGNHEFNAICYATEIENGFIRDHSEKNTGQHKAFLKEFPFGSDKYQETIAWFKTLPAYLDLKEIGIVHACWCPDSLEVVRGLMDNGRLIQDVYAQYADKTSKTYHAIEQLLKGPEHSLPKELYFHDKDGNLRKEARIKWWVEHTKPASERLEFGGVDISNENKKLLDNHVPPKSFIVPDKLIFVGHYWLKGTPEPLSDKAACVDYSVAKGGKMTAYCWSGEQSINVNNYVWV